MSLFIYHERQVGNLCGVHCINSLLQGGYFSELDLSKIGQELDRIENQLLPDPSQREKGWSNVANDGMFSMQVLTKALEVWSLHAVPLENPRVRALKNNPTLAEAFVCHLDDHWFALRRLADGGWWDLNSLLPAPRALSGFYVTAFLDSLREQGYSIFVIQGDLPPVSQSVPPSPHGRWISKEEAIALTEAARQARDAGRLQRERGDDEEAGGGKPKPGVVPFTGAKHSLRDNSNTNNSNGKSGGGGGGGGGTGLASATMNVGIPEVDPNVDPELAAAIAESLASEQDRVAGALAKSQALLKPEPPKEAGDSVTVAFRLSNGSRITRRFRLSDPVEQLFVFLRTEFPDGGEDVKIFNAFPRKELTRPEVSLAVEGITGNAALAAELGGARRRG